MSILQRPPLGNSLGAGGRERERETYFKIPTFLCGSFPALVDWLEGASLVCLLFLTGVEFLCLDQALHLRIRESVDFAQLTLLPNSRFVKPSQVGQF